MKQSPVFARRKREARELAARYAHKIHRPARVIPEDAPRSPTERIFLLRQAQNEFDRAASELACATIAYARTFLNMLEDPEACDMTNRVTALNVKEVILHLLKVFETFKFEGKTADKSDIAFRLQEKLDQALAVITENSF